MDASIHGDYSLPSYGYHKGGQTGVKRSRSTDLEEGYGFMNPLDSGLARLLNHSVRFQLKIWVLDGKLR